MDYRQFLAKVREYSGLTKEDSLKIIEAVLETLGERLSRKHRKHLAVQLSRELKPFVLKHRKTELFSLESFYQNVATRARLLFHDSIKQTRPLVRVLQAALLPLVNCEISLLKFLPSLISFWDGNPARYHPYRRYARTLLQIIVDPGIEKGGYYASTT